MKLLNKLRWRIWPYIKYFKVVGRMRPWDYGYVLDMMQHQLGLLSGYMDRSQTHVTTKDDVKDIRRVMELIEHKREDTYADRCGFDHDWEFVGVECEFEGMMELRSTETPEQARDNQESIQWAIELENKEWEEMIGLMSKMKDWWD